LTDATIFSLRSIEYAPSASDLPGAASSQPAVSCRLRRKVLGSSQSGKLQGVAFWESEEALRATDQSVVPIREGVAEAAGGTVAGVEEFEVFVFEAPSTGPVSGVTDTVRGATVNLLGGGEKQR
jgi:hypothetical protein